MRNDRPITLFMCGDVMTGRGVDQILPCPSEPGIHEPYMKSAMGYVEIAERANGPIPKPVDFSYVWGEALNELEKAAPDFRIINLETAVTTSQDYWRGKGINYRMNPANVDCLVAARIDFCSLANNHVLDWGHSGLAETLSTLRTAGISYAGAGGNLAEAEAPGILPVGMKGRVIIFSLGSPSSGIPPGWAASATKPGVNLINGLTESEVMRLREKVSGVRRPGDMVVVSIHWGGNWGYDISSEEMQFAHLLIDTARADIVHGHSSHHVKGIEVYKGRLILYGCGDFLNDYEGITGYEEFRDDLGVMYFATIEPSDGHLLGLRMIATQTRSFQVHRASRADALWLKSILNREGRALGTRTVLDDDESILLEWD